MFNQTTAMSTWLMSMQDSMAANSVNFAPSTDLTIKQPIGSPLNLTNFQAASASAGVIGNLFESPQAGMNPFGGLGGSMPMLAGLGNLFSGSSMMPSMPMPNMTGIGMPPLEMMPFIFGMAGATGAIDPTTMMMGMTASTTGGMPGMGMPGMGMDMTSLMMGLYGMPGMGMPGMGMPGMTGAVASQGTDANIAALMKKMPLLSAAKTESILTKSTDIKAQWSGVSKEVSLMSADDSKFTLLNAALPDASSKAEFITNVSTNIDKEVRLAGRGASKEVVAEVFANELYSVYEKKNPNAKYTDSKQKEKIISGLKDICAGKVEPRKDNSWGQPQYGENVQAALQILPSISTKENNPNNNWNGWNGGWGGNSFPGFIGIGGGNNGNSGNPTIKLLEQTTNDLTSAAKDNLIQRNSLA